MTTKLQGGFWVGVDVGKRTVDACVASVHARPGQWAKLPVGHFATDEQGIAALGQWLRSALEHGPCVGVCIESTGAYSHRFVRAIEHLGLPEVSMVNPALPVAFRKSLGLRDKCDRVDAAVLALYGIVHRPAPNTNKDKTYEQLRTLKRLHDDYDTDVQRWENRLEQCLDDTMRAPIMETIAYLKRCRKDIWRTIQQRIKEQDALGRDVALLCSIPGVGEKTAVLVLAEFGNLRSWSRTQLVSYAGLYPKVYSSGTSVHLKPRLARGGGARIRKGLYMPACGQLRTNTRVACWARELIARGKTKMEAIGAIMRKQLQLMRGVLVSGVPYQDKHPKAFLTH